MRQTYRVALLGFSASERIALVAAFAAPRSHGALFCVGDRMLPLLDDADFIVADADHAQSVQLVVVTERMGDTLFIGASPPLFGAAAWMLRPCAPLHVLRELDALVAPALGDGRIEPPLGMQVAVQTGSQAAVQAGAQAGARAEAQAGVDVALHTASGPAADAASGAVLDVDLDDAFEQPFPAWPLLPPCTPEPAVTLRAWTAPTGTRALRALVVDDSDTARQFLRKRLEAWGLEVDTAASSGQALILLFRQHFDHLFIDVELGSGSRLDGLGLCQLVRRQNVALGGAPELVVIVSAHQGHIDRARGLLAGCDAYLGKPLDDADLDALLRRQGLKPPASTAAC